VATRKKKGANISVFKGRTRNLTKVIFWILGQHSPLAIYDIFEEVRQQKGLRHTKYSVVNHRVRKLEELGFLEKSGTRKTLTDMDSALYQLTTKAYLAIILENINLEAFLGKANENETTTALALFTQTL
jgi:repressor of nif and glnA expression